ncbi:venom dipeptidyl peptidase 4 isoform X2 [Sitophilus oryzae]|uniref:Venom dipeptidyl peptidase 4 n=1 Tax=Sitophilus oryzae TaxID=7048 RepID=A0A6J2XJI9_SITOR|nr:venom dipeptidyl peptidase 4 isoform X2 [Sitophilus oryzae]
MPENNGVSNTNGTLNMEIGQSNQDLITSKDRKKKRNWIISGVGGVVVIALIVAIVVLVDGRSNDAEAVAAESLNLEDLLSYKYNPKSFNGTWVSGSKFTYSNEDGDLVLYDLASGSSKTLLHANDSILSTAFEFQISADNRYLLVAHDFQKLYRHSFKARYTIINLETGNKEILQAPSALGTGLDFSLVQFAPVDNALVYISEYNIYYKPSVDSDQVVQLTNTTGFITNGIPDWVYEEEIFGSNKAFWFSADGKKLAYIRFNDTATPIMVVPVYGEPGSLYFQYPRANIIKYPKAGTTNPTVQLFAVDLTDYEETELEVSSNLANTQPLITAVTWTTNDSVAAVWMNRVQNTAEIVLYQHNSSVPKVVSTYHPDSKTSLKHVLIFQIKSLSETKGWVELFSAPHVSQDGNQLALLLSKTEGSDAYRHLALLNTAENSNEQFLTNGTYVVSEVLGWNHNNNLIYYTATLPSDSSVQHIYSVSPTSGEVKCISCSLTSKNTGAACTYNTAEISTDSTHLVATCAGPDIPDTTILSSDGSVELVWTKNEALVEILQGKTLSDRTKLEFEVADGFTAKVLLKLPHNLDTSGNTKYPMLVYVYGGPDTYLVIDKYTLDWGDYLAANKSIIYAAIDGRGSGLRGNNLLFSGYRNLGSVEVIDQVNVTKMIQAKLPYVDSERTAIWGWSYGGYVAGMALATDTEDVFKCGISVAPVTDWALYDSIYTERFMGLPTSEDNLAGYTNSQLLTKYAGLKDKEYFLIHGTFDDNVHYQQSMMWARVLERNDILFRQLSYPDEDHSLSSVRPHLYHSLENFLDECFVK